MEQASFEVVPSTWTFGLSLVGVLIVCDTFMYDLSEEKKTRRRWIRTTGTLLPLGFEVQALNLQSSSAQNCRV
jgi:hypothetical protein